MLVLCLALVQCQKTYWAIPPWSLSPGLIFLFSRKTALTYFSNDNAIHSANKLLNLRFITCTSVVETLRKLSGWILSAWGWILLPGPDSFVQSQTKWALIPALIHARNRQTERALSQTMEGFCDHGNSYLKKYKQIARVLKKLLKTICCTYG